MPAYPDELPLREARERYFAASGFDASQYDADWVRFKVGPLPIAFPNTASRKAAVPCHDLHHVATGYATDVLGEGEAGAWELGSGCAGVGGALLLVLLATWPGLLLAPRRIYRAFLRGRASRNLFGRPWDEARLDRSVGELRRELGLDAPPRAATAADRLAFARWMAVVVGLQLAIVAVVFGPPLAWWLGAFG